MVGVIETDEKISKGNCRSRKRCSADDLILEKIFLCDCSMKNMEQTVYNFTYLESYYNRQLENVHGVAEEETGVDRLKTKLFTKVMPRFE